ESLGLGSLPPDVPPLAPLLSPPEDAGACLVASSCRHRVFSSPLNDSQLDDGADADEPLPVVPLPLPVALCANAPKASTVDPIAAAINCNFMNISLSELRSTRSKRHSLSGALRRHFL